MKRAIFICFSVFILLSILVAAIVATSIFLSVKRAAEVHFKSPADTFHVTVLEVNSKPNYFMERIRIKCDEDMEASIWVTDLKKAGMFERSDTNGLLFYREGDPHKVGSSAVVHADGGFSTCEILFSVSTNSSRTVWHDEVAGGTLDTTLSFPLAISAVETNWSGAYERGSAIPLANLGDYKILVSAK